MHTMNIKRFLLTAAILLGSKLQAQTDAILWQISGNGLSKPSYIFGTIHAYCDREKFFKPELTDALKSTDVVAMELNLNDFSTFVALMKASMKEADQPLSSKLSPSEYRSVDSACMVLLGDSLRNMDLKTPMGLMGKMYLSESMIGCNPIPLDFLIAELAKREKKTSYGLETAAFQDSLMNAIPDSLQIRWLLDLSRNLAKAKADFALLMSTYESQSSQDLYDVSFKTSPEMGYLKEALLDQRNKSWLTYLKANMPLNAHFVAVGAAHLAGPEGMIALLKGAGYTLTPVLIRF